MNRRQLIVLSIGCFLILIHTILYFPNVHVKYGKLQHERKMSKTNYSLAVLDAIKDREDTFRRALLAWSVVSACIITTAGFSFWLFKNNSKI